jgi:hypothetical protein
MYGQDNHHCGVVDHPIKSTQLGHLSHLVISPIWTSLPSGLPLSQQKSENCNSVQCRLFAKILFLCWYHIENLSL